MAEVSFQANGDILKLDVTDGSLTSTLKMGGSCSI